MKKMILTIMAVVMLSAPVWAGTSMHFGNFDGNGDGKVTEAEYNAHFDQEPGMKGRFAEVDANGDGAFDHDEWHDFKAKNDYGHEWGEKRDPHKKKEHGHEHEHGHKD